MILAAHQKGKQCAQRMAVSMLRRW